MASAEAGIEERGRSTARTALARITVALTALLAVGGALSTWNPWRLVLLDAVPGIGTALAGFGACVIAASRTWRTRRRPLRRPCAFVGIATCSVGLLICVVALCAPLLTPFTSLREERSISIDENVRVVRWWNSGALHSCVDVEVRSGHGIWTRHGAARDAST